MPRWLKALVACALLGALALGVDWRSIPAQLAVLDWRLALLGLAVVLLELPANASKWSFSLRLHGLAFGWVYLWRTGCFGFFFNNFLPSAIGGDVYRVYRTMAPGAARSPAVSAVLVERAVGLAAMLCNGAVGALLLVHTSPLARAYLGLAAAGAGVAAAFAICLKLGWFDRAGALLGRLAFLKPVQANLRRIARPSRAWALLIAGSFVFQFLATAVVYLAFASVGADLSIAAAALVTAAAGIAAVLPISISGIGVVEGSIAGTAVALGAGYDAAVLAAIVVRLQALAVGAACGLLYLTESGGRPPPGEQRLA
jgi:hypothetical protein